jgi:D-alanyl-D-alanine carboxypeptidase/D-alanyl-D-alanine-endopeptidase (penicillin-binding protein 4)
LVLLAGAVACLIAGLRGDRPALAKATDDPTTAATPLLSPRRIPYVFVDAATKARLQASLATFAAPYTACIAVDDASGPLARVRADQGLAPASTAKLLTAAAALYVLGPDHTFVTRASTDAAGNLYVTGAGDPVLTTPAYETRLRNRPRTATDPITPLTALADSIAASGVESVNTVVGDGSRHHDVSFLSDWKAGYVEDIGELDALTVDDGYAGTTRVDDPTLLAAQQLAAMLRERGITVGDSTTGTAPAGTTEVGSVASPPLADIVAAMLMSSDNLTAELLTREIGLARGGTDGSTAAGTSAIVAALAELGVPTGALDVRDGSGLAPANRVTCDAILGALALGSRPEFAAIDRGLAVAGQSGTLVNRLRGDPLEGVLRAKTGNIDDVAGLAGIVDDAEHLRFAFVVNDDFTESGGQALQVEVARLIAAYPDAPAASELVPPP